MLKSRRMVWRVKHVSRPERGVSVFDASVPSTVLRVAMWQLPGIGQASAMDAEAQDEKAADTPMSKGLPYQSIVRELQFLPREANADRRVKAWLRILSLIVNAAKDASSNTVMSTLPTLALFATATSPDDAKDPRLCIPWRNALPKDVLNKPVVITLNFATVDAAKAVAAALQNGQLQHDRLGLALHPVEHHYFRFRFSANILDSVQDIKNSLHTIGFVPGSYVIDNEADDCYDVNERGPRRLAFITAPLPV